MCFYQDTQLLSKRIFSNLGAWEDTQDSKSFNLSKNEQEGLINDVLIKKKKILGIFPDFSQPLTSSLDHKAPGLFEHLTKISQEDINTDVTSVGSEMETEENKPLLHIPIPRKASTTSDHVHNLSMTVKGPIKHLENQVQENQKPEVKGSMSAIEEEQQQKILHFLMQNSMMLNHVIIQNDTSRKMVAECREAITYFR